MKSKESLAAERRRKNQYPKNWAEISLRHRMNANWICEGSPAYPDCRAENGQPHPITGSNVVLTVAHLDHNPQNCAADNLRAMCQRCHLRYDQELHKKNAADTNREKLQNMAFPFFENTTG